MQAHSTSLSTLSDHEWHILSSRWSRGIDWTVCKMGRKWIINIDHPSFRAFPLFRTKTAAYDAATNLILAESRYRASRRIA
jgi:hypothetical protein